MSDSVNSEFATAFEILADYERRSLAHVVGLPAQMQASGTWHGIGFRIGEVLLVASLSEVSEILVYPQVARVAGSRAWLLGVASVRGDLVPLIDLKQFLHGDATLLGESSRVLVVRQGGGGVGLLVDEVLGQRNFSAEQRVAKASTQADTALDAYILDSYALGDAQWRHFSIAALTRSAEFLQGAA